MEDITGLTVFDRTQVILDIFDNNAKTREAKLLTLTDKRIATREFFISKKNTMRKKNSTSTRLRI